jgi:hypothetical protein
MVTHEQCVALCSLIEDVLFDVFPTNWDSMLPEDQAQCRYFQENGHES